MTNDLIKICYYVISKQTKSIGYIDCFNSLTKSNWLIITELIVEDTDVIYGILRELTNG